MNSYFDIGDLLIDKTQDPNIIGLIEKVECNNGTIIVYKCICPSSNTGLLWWKEEYVLDGLMNGETAVHRRIRH